MDDWRLAKSLERLRAQVNAARPNRKKGSDGTIGNPEHASRGDASDHNPWIRDGNYGVVTAWDVTHDPAGGFDSYKFADWLRTTKPRRVKYVISNGRIFSSITSPWTWRSYTQRNKHTLHCHISVMKSKALFDDASDWDVAGFFEGADPGPSPGVDRPVLRRGSEGAAVKELQTKLGIESDGYFGPDTEAAVSLFQRRRGLDVDGIVGGDTWAELERDDPAGPINNPKQTDIVCTKFGGSGDPNKSAYPPYAVIDDNVLGCALPWRFPGIRPPVRVTNVANKKSVTVSILDLGPWNTDDPYWTTGQRPQAETGRDEKGRKTNFAGIDLTPAADRAIELDGLGRVDWEFVLAPTDSPPGGPGYSAITVIVEEMAGLSETIATASAVMAKLTAELAALLETTK